MLLKPGSGHQLQTCQPCPPATRYKNKTLVHHWPSVTRRWASDEPVSGDRRRWEPHLLLGIYCCFIESNERWPSPTLVYYFRFGSRRLATSLVHSRFCTTCILVWMDPEMTFNSAQIGPSVLNVPRKLLNTARDVSLPALNDVQPCYLLKLRCKVI